MALARIFLAVLTMVMSIVVVTGDGALNGKVMLMLMSGAGLAYLEIRAFAERDIAAFHEAAAASEERAALREGTK